MEDDSNRLNTNGLYEIDVAKIERFEKVLKFNRLTKSEMAERLGIHQSNLSKILLGKRPIGKSMDAKFILAFPEISKEWFLHGEGNMLKDGYTTFEPVGMVGASTPTSQGASNLENEMKILQAEIELKDKLIASLQEEVNVLRDMNRQMLQAITKSMESQAQQKNT